MSTAICENIISDLELPHDVIDEGLQNGGRLKTVDEVLGEFREYLADVERLREEIHPALEHGHKVHSD